MKPTLVTLLFFISIIGLYSCGGDSKDSRPPKFIDNGKVVDSIKLAYDAERIEFENWEPDDATDDQLTICLINNKKDSPNVNRDMPEQVFKSIATSIRRSLVDNAKYKSYYVIFVEVSGNGFMQTKSHKAGMNVPVSILDK